MDTIHADTPDADILASQASYTNQPSVTAHVATS